MTSMIPDSASFIMVVAKNGVRGEWFFKTIDLVKRRNGVFSDITYKLEKIGLLLEIHTLVICIGCLWWPMTALWLAQIIGLRTRIW